MTRLINRLRCLLIILPASMITTDLMVLPRIFCDAPVTETAARNLPSEVSKKKFREMYGRLPLSFEANLGQADARVKFISRGSGHSLFLTATEAILHLMGRNVSAESPARAAALPAIHRPTSSILRMKMIGASASSIEPAAKLPGKSNYFIGNDPRDWTRDVPNYEKVIYRDIYAGVDLIFYGNQRQLECDFVVAPGARPGVIRIGFYGAQRIKIDNGGDLVLSTRAGQVRLTRPFVYQEIDGARRQVAGRYALLGGNRVSLRIGVYDRSRPLIIDPIFSYSTYLGGDRSEQGQGIVLDQEGNAYITGQTSSLTFPLTPGAFSGTFNGDADAFVTKLNPSGSALLYSTYLGGQRGEVGTAITIDPSGNAYITGLTLSPDFPTTPGAFQVEPVGQPFSSNAFVTKLNSSGAALVYSTYLGGSGSFDAGNSIAIDSSGNAYIAGDTNSPDFPTTPGAFQTNYEGGGVQGRDVFITKLNSAGTALVYSTYLGGSNTDQCGDIRVDAAGNAYVTGGTASEDFDVTPGAYQTIYGGPATNFIGDAYITKLNSAGTALVYSTYLGDKGTETANGLALSPAGDVFVTGFTQSRDYPTTPGVSKVIREGAAKTTDGGLRWKAINEGLIGSNVVSYAVDPLATLTVFACVKDAGVFKSTNGGDIWAVTNSGLTTLNLECMAIDPVNPSTLYVGTFNRGVFKTTNGGASWAAVNTGLSSLGIGALRIVPGSPSIVYAAAGGGIFKTTDGGTIWSATGLQDAPIINIDFDPQDPLTLYAGLHTGVFKSTDGGDSWAQTSLKGVAIRAIAIDPFTSAVFAGTEAGIFRSTDRGSTWRPVSLGLTNRIINTLTTEQTGLADKAYKMSLQPAILYAGTHGGAFKSTDGGNTWSSINVGLAGLEIRTLTLDPSSSNIAYVGAPPNFNIGEAFVTKLNPSGTALTYSTLLGGAESEEGLAIEADSAGNAFITGWTESRRFPTTRGCFGILRGFQDAFVTKLDPAGASLLYSTYLGGSNFERGLAIAVDSSGGAYVTGVTESRDYPVTEGAFQTVFGGVENSFFDDAFITRLLPDPRLTSDLAVTVTVESSSATIGSQVRYDFTLTNLGPDDAPGVSVIGDIPFELDNATCSSSAGFCSVFGPTAVLDIASISAGESKTFSISALLNCSLPDGLVFANTVTVDSSAFDLDLSNNSVTALIAAVNPQTTINPSSAVHTAPGGEGATLVSRQADCNWTLTSNAGWISAPEGIHFGNQTIIYTVAANTGARRTGTLRMAGEIFRVTQFGRCNTSLTQSSSSFAANGGLGLVNVATSETGCSYSVSTDNPDFISITSGDTGIDGGFVTFFVAPNSGILPRTGTINIGDKIFTVYQGANFNDVPSNHPFYTEIGKLSARGVTLGCGGGNYCPDDVVTRQQMAAFIIRALGSFNPPPPAMQRFSDVPPSNPFYSFIEQMAILQITLGCGGGNYCPTDPVLRDQMAAFIIRALHEPGYIPPTPAMQRFPDVPPGNAFYAHIEEMAVRQITLGCGGGNYCPSLEVSRGQMAAFLVRAFNL